MALDKAFDPLMQHTVSIAPFSSRDADNAITYGAAVNYSAAIDLNTRLVRAPDGQQLAGRGTVFLDTTTVPGVKDKLTLPAGFEPLVPPILVVMPQYDEDGLHHVEVVIA